MNTITSKCYIGIDPSFRKGGFAVCIIDEDDTVDFIVFEGFLSFLDWLWEAPQNGVYCVENSNLQNVTFNMKGSKQVIAKISRDVGKNQACSQYTYFVLRKMFGSNAMEVSPKDKGAKWDNSTMQAVLKMNKHPIISNYKGNKNEQDKRDAYMLALLAKKR